MHLEKRQVKRVEIEHFMFDDVKYPNGWYLVIYFMPYEGKHSRYLQLLEKNENNT